MMSSVGIVTPTQDYLVAISAGELLALDIASGLALCLQEENDRCHVAAAYLLQQLRLSHIKQAFAFLLDGIGNGSKLLHVVVNGHARTAEPVGDGRDKTAAAVNRLQYLLRRESVLFRHFFILST